MPGMERTAAVTGATGFVGRSVVGELLGHGWRVRALVRSDRKARAVLPESDRLTLVPGDVLDSEALDRLFDGATDSVHLVGIIRESGRRQTFENMHHLATRRVVEAAGRTGRAVRHLQMSALGVDDASAIPYRRTKRAGERVVEGSSLAWTIFRPSMIHGPAGEFTGMAAAWVRGRAAPFVFVPYFVPGWLPGGPGARVAPVRVEDVAAAFRTALERPETAGRTYDLAGPEALTFDAMLRAYRERTPGAKRLPILGVPSRPAAAVARLHGAVGLGRLLPFDEGMALMASEDSVGDAAPARADLGFDPQAFTESLASYAARL